MESEEQPRTPTARDEGQWDPLGESPIWSLDWLGCLLHMAAAEIQSVRPGPLPCVSRCSPLHRCYSKDSDLGWMLHSKITAWPDVCTGPFLAADGLVSQWLPQRKQSSSDKWCPVAGPGKSPWRLRFAHQLSPPGGFNYRGSGLAQTDTCMASVSSCMFLPQVESRAACSKTSTIQHLQARPGHPWAPECPACPGQHNPLVSFLSQGDSFLILRC